VLAGNKAELICKHRRLKPIATTAILATLSNFLLRLCSLKRSKAFSTIGMRKALPVHHLLLVLAVEFSAALLALQEIVVHFHTFETMSPICNCSQKNKNKLRPIHIALGSPSGRAAAC